MHLLQLGYRVSFILFPLFFASSAWCERPIRGAEQLQVGMDQYQVLKILGSPRGQIEQEVKRRVLWSYPGVELVFVDGRLIDSMSSVNEATVATEQKSQQSSQQKSSKGNDLLDILHEISKSAPANSGPDTANMPTFDLQAARQASSPPATTVFPLNLPPGVVQPIQQPE